ncbi:MAG: hypothetical protein IPP15_21150 [Saprospiraceae bacterium]|uniref:Uncharacterized protein n=1 Tax=Candidatus Opimibacter skivensis TaxID=2982028 RepID=A0A9D7XVM6_9BACT|nr:hypothetical protein [Candidatus Opimibacter skivensis]
MRLGPNGGLWWNPSDPQHTEQAYLLDSTRIAADDAVTRGKKWTGL